MYIQRNASQSLSHTAAVQRTWTLRTDAHESSKNNSVWLEAFVSMREKFKNTFITENVAQSRRAHLESSARSGEKKRLTAGDTEYHHNRP